MNIGIALNKLFTVNSLNKLVTGVDTRNYKSLTGELFEQTDSISNLQALTTIYKLMAKKHRNEYFYKNILLNKILLGRHSIRTSTALRELPVNNNILDFLIINGVGQVYEIKTELDNLQRLNKQLDAYYHAFSLCNVVTDQNHLEEVMKIIENPKVGIMILTKRNTLHVEREPTNFDEKLDHKTMFNILRKYEFESILRLFFGYLPEASDFHYYEECFQMFSKVNIKAVQKAMLIQLKRRVEIASCDMKLFKEVPPEIKSLVYFSGYHSENFSELQQFLVKTVGDV